MPLRPLKDDPFKRKAGLETVEEKPRLRISQEAFDEAVLDNIEMFEYSPEEAVKETVKEFELQGVDLSNIAKLPPGEKHPVAATIDFLRKSLEPRTGILLDGASVEEVQASLSKLSSECKGNSQAREMIADKVAVDYIVSAVQRALESNNLCLLTEALGALSAVSLSCRRSQDRLGDDGVQAVSKSFRVLVNRGDEEKDDINTVAGDALRRSIVCIRSLGLKNEANRQKFCGEGLLEVKLCQQSGHNFTNCLQDLIGFIPRASFAEIKELSKLLRSLLFDDDHSALAAKAHQRAMEMVELGAIREIMGRLWNSSQK